VKDNLVW